MSTATQINKEVESLPKETQLKVLAFVELLKFNTSVADIKKLSIELGGADILLDEDASVFLEETKDPQEIQEKIALAKRINLALSRMKAGDSGVSQDVMKKRIRQWRKK